MRTTSWLAESHQRPTREDRHHRVAVVVVAGDVGHWAALFGGEGGDVFDGGLVIARAEGFADEQGGGFFQRPRASLQRDGA